LSTTKKTTRWKLTSENYYSAEANERYFSVSQYKDFRKCPAMAMAKLRGEYEVEQGRALLLGSYLDEMLTGTDESVKQFLVEHMADIFKKNGDRYADILQADEVLLRIRKQPLMMHYLSGEHQTIMTGEIEGVPFKIKMDSYRPGEYIADLKYMASLRAPNLFEPMISFWGYDIQAAVYQEIVRQNTGETLPFFFVVATKEKPAHLSLGKISQWNMDDALASVRENIATFADIKRGKLEPERCEEYNCDYCTETKLITEPIDTDFFGLSAAQMRERHF
jgi:hypothetical protein